MRGTAQFAALAVVVALFGSAFGYPYMNRYPGYGNGYNFGQFYQPSLGYGGGLSFTANINPFNTRDPIDFAYGLAFGYGLDAGPQKLTNVITTSGSGGNGIGNTDGTAGASDGFGYGTGNVNTLVRPSPGYQQSFTNNIAFSGNQGNGYGQGNAVGAVVPGWQF